MDWNEQDLAFAPDETTNQQVRLPDTPSAENDSKESAPPHAANIKPDVKSKTQYGKKGVVFLILVLCVSAGGLVLGLINILNKENCSCSSRGMR